MKALRSLFALVVFLSVFIATSIPIRADNGFPSPWHSLNAVLYTYAGSTSLDNSNSTGTALCSITNAGCDKIQLVWYWLPEADVNFPFAYYVQFYTGNTHFVDTQNNSYDCQTASWFHNGNIISSQANITCGSGTLAMLIDYTVPATQTHAYYPFKINVRDPNSPYSIQWTKTVTVNIK